MNYYTFLGYILFFKYDHFILYRNNKSGLPFDAGFKAAQIKLLWCGVQHMSVKIVLKKPIYSKFKIDCHFEIYLLIGLINKLVDCL